MSSVETNLHDVKKIIEEDIEELYTDGNKLFFTKRIIIYLENESIAFVLFSKDKKALMINRT